MLATLSAALTEWSANMGSVEDVIARSRPTSDRGQMMHDRDQRMHCSWFALIFELQAECRALFSGASGVVSVSGVAS